MSRENCTVGIGTSITYRTIAVPIQVDSDRQKSHLNYYYYPIEQISLHFCVYDGDGDVCRNDGCLRLEILYSSVRHCTYGSVRTAPYDSVRHCTALYGSVRRSTCVQACLAKTMGNVRNRFPIAILVRCPILLAGVTLGSTAFNM